MYIADEGITLIGLAISAACCHDTAITLDEFLHFCLAHHLASMASDAIDQGVYYQIAVALESPTALYETAVAVGKSEEGQ